MSNVEGVMVAEYVVCNEAGLSHSKESLSIIVTAGTKVLEEYNPLIDTNSKETRVNQVESSEKGTDGMQTEVVVGSEGEAECPIIKETTENYLEKESEADGCQNDRVETQVDGVVEDYVSEPETEKIEHLSKHKEYPSDGDVIKSKILHKGGRILRSSSRVPSKPNRLNL